MVFVRAVLRTEAGKARALCGVWYRGRRDEGLADVLCALWELMDGIPMDLLVSSIIEIARVLDTRESVLG